MTEKSFCVLIWFERKGDKNFFISYLFYIVFRYDYFLRSPVKPFFLAYLLEGAQNAIFTPHETRKIAFCRISPSNCVYGRSDKNRSTFFKNYHFPLMSIISYFIYFTRGSDCPESFTLSSLGVDKMIGSFLLFRLKMTFNFYPCDKLRYCNRVLDFPLVINIAHRYHPYPGLIHVMGISVSTCIF